MDDDEFNKKLNNLIKKNEILEKKNKEFEERLKKAEGFIFALNQQQILLKGMYKKVMDILGKQYNSKKDNIPKQISQIEEKYNNKKEKNEIIINKEQNIDEELFNIKEKDKIFSKTLTQKHIKIPNNKFDLLPPQKGIKIDKKQEKKINDNINKFEKNLTKIYNSIPKNIETDLRKISKALIIQGKEPSVIREDFFKKLSNNKKKNADSIQNMELKKNFINKEIEKILNELKIIIESDDKEFKKKFKEKYGITEKDIKDQKLDLLIEKHGKKEELIIKELLINLKYLLKGS